MPPSLFIADLHLCPTRPRVADRFLAFLRREARQAEALYILGDLFEYWVGDDDLADPFNAVVVAALRELADAGVALRLMAGNRDFLIGTRFAEASGAQLLPDPVLERVAGRPTLLSHGDLLCTGDAEYQRFRSEVRGDAWRNAFLAQDLAVRKARVEDLRRQSEAAKQRKTMAAMDVEAAAVTALLRAHGVPPCLIHGHIHRPARHELVVDGKACERWVLPAWDQAPGYLQADASGCRAAALAA